MTARTNACAGAALAMAILLAGCAGESDSSDENSAAAAASASANASPSPTASASVAPGASASASASPSAMPSGPWDDASTLSAEEAAYSLKYGEVPNMWELGYTLDVEGQSPGVDGQPALKVPEGSELLGPTPGVYANDLLAAWGEEVASTGEEFAARFLYETYLSNETTYDATLEACQAYLTRTESLIAEEWRDAWHEMYGSDDYSYPCTTGTTNDAFNMYSTTGGATVPDLLPSRPDIVISEHALVDAAVNPDAAESAIYKFEYQAARPANFNLEDGSTDVPGVISMNGEWWIALEPAGDTFIVTGWYGQLDTQGNPVGESAGIVGAS